MISVKQLMSWLTTRLGIKLPTYDQIRQWPVLRTLWNYKTDIDEYPAGDPPWEVGVDSENGWEIIPGLKAKKLEIHVTDGDTKIKTRLKSGGLK